jgi:hypothetical protein
MPERIELRAEIVDIAAVRRRGDAGEKIALAKRIFSLWQPIFSHLDTRDYTFHLEKHVEDATATQIRGIFGVDREGKDRALMIVRVHEHLIGGRIWARLTKNAGVDPAVVQSGFGQPFVAWEIWRYRLKHPFRPFFIVDNAVSPAAYCGYAKTYSGFAPTAARGIPERWWPLAAEVAAAMDGRPVDGLRREVRRFPAVVRDPRPQRPPSARSQAAARFFEEATGGDPALGVLVMAPLTFSRCAFATLRYLLVGAR